MLRKLPRPFYNDDLNIDQGWLQGAIIPRIPFIRGFPVPRHLLADAKYMVHQWIYLLILDPMSWERHGCNYGILS
jgi:hypothetical protein